jgi:hypothetical protein
MALSDMAYLSTMKTGIDRPGVLSPPSRSGRRGLRPGSPLMCGGGRARIEIARPLPGEAIRKGRLLVAVPDGRGGLSAKIRSSGPPGPGARAPARL